MSNKSSKSVIYLTANGYGISSIYGKILLNGRTFNTLNDAKSFCESNNMDFEIA